MGKLIVAFSDFANAPKSVQLFFYSDTTNQTGGRYNLFSF